MPAPTAAVAFRSLWDRDKADLACPSMRAEHGIRRVNVGRKVGTRRNVRYVSSADRQARKKMAVERLDPYDRRQDAWLKVLIEDRHADPAETAASRIDFSAWLESLSRRDRKIAWKLALGEATRQVARWFRVSDGRVSQLRRELERLWQAFHGELAAA